MKNGLVITRKAGDNVQSVHIDEDVLGFAHLNRLTGRRQRAAAANIADKQRSSCRRKKAALNTAKWSATMFALSTGLLWSMAVGYVVPLIALPGVAVCLCIASCKIGLYAGRYHKKEKHHE